MTPHEKFLSLKDEIPPYRPPPKQFSFVLAKKSGNLLILSGHGPNLKEAPPKFDYVGKVGKDLTIDEGYSASRLVGLNLLVSCLQFVKSLDDVDQVLRADGFVNCDPGFVSQSRVLNGCTDLFVEIFGENGKCSLSLIHI